MWAPLAINLEYIAAYIENDVDEIKIVNQEFDDTDITHHLKEFNPDIFGMTMSAVDQKEGLSLCKTAKKMGATTIVGGFQPTAIPDEILNHRQVDMVFRGEGEQTMREFITSGAPENIDGISYRNNGSVIHNAPRDLIKDLDSIPFPARHHRRGDECHRWLTTSGLHRDQVHASRGCWGRCTFCCEPSMSHSIQRYRAPENVFEEIKEVYSFHHEEPLLILLGDPHFLGKPKHIEPLCDLLIEADMDITFCAMVRADMIAKNPPIVEKMVKAGIVAYCMGMETPDEGGLKNTKKGISNKAQAKAVHLLRKNHANAGGTFVMGLPGQTEEEIKTFPEYARHLGMTNAAFAIATPQAGTEFYNELDSARLIDIRDWNLHDQMHSVFKHDQVSRHRLEQLLAYCMGRFYAPDVFIDDMIDSQYRDEEGRKITLTEVQRYFRDRLNFILTAGSVYRPNDGQEFGAIFLKAQVNPWTRKRTEKIGLHNMMELEAFLRVFGNQKVQLSVYLGDDQWIYYVIKTTKTTFDFIDVCDKPHKDSTLTIEIDFSDARQKKSKFILKTLFNFAKQGQLFNLSRGIFAALVNHIAVTKSRKPPKSMSLPKEYLEDGFRYSGWDKEGYLKLKSSK
jgi:radical SAM superfamily enzyme YgiQ (UPF0313 family)